MKSENKSGKLVKIINIALCVAVIFVLGILAWVLPQPTYSEYERRDLNRCRNSALKNFLQANLQKE